MTTIPRSPIGTPSWVRDWWIDVLISGGWVPLRGLTQFSPDSSVATDEVVTLKTDGWAFPVKAGMSWSLGMSVSRKSTRDAAPVYDIGQEALRDAAEDGWGTATLRWYKMDAVRIEAYQGTGIVQYNPAGGSVADLDEAALTITGQGARARIAHPAVA